MRSPPYSAWEDMCCSTLFISNNFATSATLAEVCALLSAVLVASAFFFLYLMSKVFNFFYVNCVADIAASYRRCRIYCKNYLTILIENI